jgi:hypothetical protein
VTKQNLKLAKAPKPEVTSPIAKRVGAVAILKATTEPACKTAKPKQGNKKPPVVAPSTNSVQKTDERLKRRLPRSGGPKTAEGKAKSLLNSLKHYAYATRLPERDDYYQLINAAKLELQPSGLIEAASAETVAHELYRRKLIEDTEMQRIRASEFKRLDPAELARRVDFPFGQAYQHLLVEPLRPHQLFTDFSKDWNELASPPISGADGELETKEDGNVVRIYKTACELLDSAQHNPYSHEEFLEIIDEVMVSAMRGENYLGRRIAARGREMMLVNYWLIVNRTELSTCTHDMRNEHKLAILTDENLSRAKKHANSNLSSGLNQFAAIRKIKHTNDERILYPTVHKR